FSKLTGTGSTSRGAADAAMPNTAAKARIKASTVLFFMSSPQIDLFFFQRGLRPLWNPRGFVFCGTYHPFLGKDVTLHIHSSEGEICAAYTAHVIRLRK